MDLAVADATVQATRQQAAAEARDDLREMTRRAVEAGRDRSRRIIKTSRIDTRTGELRYNPAGRLLRDWYLHVYLNTLRRNLGEPAVAIDAQQVEDTTSLLRRLRPHTDPLVCLHVVGAVRNIARDDASHAAAGIVDHLATVAARRAVLHAADDRFGDDTLAAHITRHWYLHCYDDTIRVATDTRHPLANMSRELELRVATAISTGGIRRLIDQHGVPLGTIHGIRLPPPDDEPAVRSTGPASLTAERGPDLELPTSSHERAASLWTELPEDQQTQWLNDADANPVAPDTSWSDLAHDVQDKLIAVYLDAQAQELVASHTEPSSSTADASHAAALMFSHRVPLDAPTAHRTPSVEQGDDREAGTDDRRVGRAAIL